MRKQVWTALFIAVLLNMPSSPGLAEKKKGEEYLDLLNIIATHSVFFSQSDARREIHRKVFQGFISQGKKRPNTPQIFWGDVFHEKNFSVLEQQLKNVNLDDDDVLTDFDPIIDFLTQSLPSKNYDEATKRVFDFAKLLAVKESGPLGEITPSNPEWKAVNKAGFFLPLHSSNEPPLSQPQFFPVGHHRVAYLQLTTFYEPGVSNLLQERMRSAEMSSIGGVILDLRGNWGGNAFEVYRILSLFLPSSSLANIVRHRNSDGGKLELFCTPVSYSQTWEKYFPEVHPLDDWRTNVPLVVLIDSFSASGSELLVHALQWNNRALIIGETTHGKALGRSSYDGTTPGEKVYLMDQVYYRLDTGETWYQKGLPPDLQVPPSEQTKEWKMKIQQRNLNAGQHASSRFADHPYALPLPSNIQSIDPSPCKKRIPALGEHPWKFFTTLSEQEKNRWVEDQTLPNSFGKDPPLGMALRSFEFLLK